MFPEGREVHKKSSLDLPIGTTVRYGGQEWIIAKAFKDPNGNGPQYSLRNKIYGSVEPSVHQSNVIWVADASKTTAVKAVWFKKDDRVMFRHNRKCGTVKTVYPSGMVEVEYDRNPNKSYDEDARHLILLHSPAEKARTPSSPPLMRWMKNAGRLPFRSRPSRIVPAS